MGDRVDGGVAPGQREVRRARHARRGVAALERQGQAPAADGGADVRRDPVAAAAIGGPRALGVQVGQPRGVARQRGRIERGQQILFERREVDAQGASS